MVALIWDKRESPLQAGPDADRSHPVATIGSY
jgi:hypothetical protein